jgi:signal peptidase I
MSIRSMLEAALPIGIVIAASVAIVLSGLGALVVTGDSMRPAMRAGDVAIYLGSASVGVGDVVVYQPSAGGRVIHRIASLEGTDTVRTRGDANTAVDREVLSTSQVRGRIVAVVPTGWMARVDWPARAATLMSQFDTKR